MKKSLFLVLAAAAITGWWQAGVLSSLGERRARLSTELALARKTATGVGQSPPDNAHRSLADAPVAPGSAATPLEVAEFMEHAGDISRMEQTLAPGADRRKLREKITALFTRLAVTPPDRLKAVMDLLPDSGISEDGKSQISRAIFGLLLKSDPAAAAEYALRGGDKQTVLPVAIRDWAKQDAAAAAAWLEKMESAGSLPPGPQRDELRRSLLPALLAADPGGAAVGEIAHISPAHLNDLMAETAGLLRNQEQRRELFRRLSSIPGMPAEAVRRFVTETGRTASVSDAFALLDESGASLPAEQFDALAIAAATARIDSSTAGHADRLLRELKAPDREGAIGVLMQAWTPADFNGAAGWLRNLPPSPDRDQGISAFAALVVEKEPPSAVDWAVTIEDPARRSATLVSLYQKWKATAPEAAAAYYQKLGIVTGAE